MPLSNQSSVANRKYLTQGSIFALLILISPYIFYLYESFPDTKSWETFLFTFEIKYYSTIYIAAWNVINKFVPLYLLTIWFITCRDWWFHALLIPMSMYMFQFVSAINDSFQYVDEFEIYYVIPVMMVVTPIVYLIRLKLFDKVVHGIDLKEIDRELKRYEDKETTMEKDPSLAKS